MKILVITTNYPNNMEPNRSIFNKERIRYLSKHSEIKIIAPIPWVPSFLDHKFSKVYKYELVDGIEIFHPRYFMIPKIGRSLYGFFFFLSIINFVKHFKKNYDFDLIYCPWVYPDGFAAALICRLLNKPLILHASGSDINYFTRFLIRRKLISYALKCSEHILVVSNALKEKLIDLGIDDNRISVVHSGVDLEKFYPMDMFYAREKCNLPREKKIVLFIGRLSEEKGVNYLVEAFSILCRNNLNDIYLVIIGEGSCKKKIMDKILSSKLNESTLMVGLKNHEEIPRWINAANLVCLPSLREGFPNVLLESLACGRPVVASNVGGVKEIIYSEDFGILVPPKDIFSLAYAIKTTLLKKWSPEKLRNNIKVKDWEYYNSLLLKLFSTIINIK